MDLQAFLHFPLLICNSSALLFYQKQFQVLTTSQDLQKNQTACMYAPNTQLPEYDIPHSTQPIYLSYAPALKK